MCLASLFYATIFSLQTTTDPRKLFNKNSIHIKNKITTLGRFYSKTNAQQKKWWALECLNEPIGGGLSAINDNQMTLK